MKRKIKIRIKDDNDLESTHHFILGSFYLMAS
jgi:hypothetical protein